jgi:hypothetical protein
MKSEFAAPTGSAAHWLWQTLAWSAGIFVVFFAVALRLYRNATS